MAGVALNAQVIHHDIRTGIMEFGVDATADTDGDWQTSTWNMQASLFVRARLLRLTMSSRSGDTGFVHIVGQKGHLSLQRITAVVTQFLPSQEIAQVGVIDQTTEWLMHWGFWELVGLPDLLPEDQLQMRHPPADDDGVPGGSFNLHATLRILQYT